MRRGGWISRRLRGGLLRGIIEQFEQALERASVVECMEELRCAENVFEVSQHVYQLFSPSFFVMTR